MFYILPGLNNLTSLRNLKISSNHIEGFKSFHGTKDFWVMHYLFTGALLLHQALYNLVFTGGEDEPLKLSNLEYLELRGNRFDNSILSSFKGLSSLKNLDLSKNQLKGSFNMKGLWTSHCSLVIPFQNMSPWLCCDLISSILLQPRIGSFEQLKEAVSQRKWDWRIRVLKRYWDAFYLNIPHERWWLHGSISPPQLFTQNPMQ